MCRAEINVNFVLFEELKERTEGGEAVARIVILRAGTDMDQALEDGANSFLPARMDTF